MGFSSMRTIACSLAVASLLFVTGPISAQAADPDTATEDAKKAAEAKKAEEAKETEEAKKAAEAEKGPRSCTVKDPLLPLALDRTTVFALEGFACAGGPASKSLLINSMDPGIRELGCDAAQKLISFRVTRDGVRPKPQTAEVWTAILGTPFSKLDKDGTYEVPVSIREEPSGPSVSCGNLRFQILHPTSTWVGVVFVALVYIGLFFAGKHTDLLRDSGPDLGPGKKRAYSLNRLQMAWWFSLVFASYVGLFLVLRDLPTIPGVILGLIGISAGTTLIAANMSNPAHTSHEESKNFFLDMATDAEGKVTIYRVQQIAWTLLFGLVFVHQVITKLSMPDFDSSVLLLMGISSGAYLLGRQTQDQANGGQGGQGGQQVSTSQDPKAGYEPTSS